jgi:hypothetical protein
VVYVFLKSLVLAAIPIAAIMAVAVALAFYKVNNKPLINVVEYGLKYLTGNKLYVWRKIEEPKIKTAGSVEEAKKYASILVPKISDSKLKDLTWSLDIKESLYSNKKQM